MLVHKSTTFIIVFLLASAFLRAPAYCDSATEKTKILSDLIKTPSLASSRVKSAPKQCSELAIDLIVYRWISQHSSLPTDVNNINPIISALANELGDGVITWAREEFSTTDVQKVTLPPRDNNQVTQLTELRKQYGMAADFNESAPVSAVTALTEALGICQKLQLDLSEALIDTELGDYYYSDMALYRQAEKCYLRAIPVFDAYDCNESAAILYDDYGALCAAMSRYLAATENYKSAAIRWSELAKDNPNTARYREMAGREYIKAGEAQNTTRNADRAFELMSYGLDQLNASA